MIDIHNHLLFGVDDGSKSLEESLEMARQYVDAGYEGVVLTAHYYENVYTSTKEDNEKRFGILKDALAKENIPLDIYLGNELYYSAHIPRWLKERKIHSMNGTAFVLMEFPMMDDPLHVSELVYQMQMEGFTPIFAHVERYAFVQKNPKVLLEYLNKGCVMQMNLDSVFSEGKTGKALQYLLERKMIQVAASDSHQSEWRSPAKIPAALEKLSTMVDENYFNQLVYENPKRIIENRRVPVEVIETKPAQEKPTGGFFKRLFKGGKS